MKPVWILASLATAAVGAAFSVSSAFAEEEGVIEEIIVTAQKRDQALKDVPMSVSAVTAEDVAAMGAVNLSELQTTVPSLTVSSLGGVAESIKIRAVSPPGSLLPVVGRYVDEMTVNAETTGYGMDFPLVDIERVEVLKGPQGTLYGEGSIGGTVRYITKGPTPGEVDGAMEVSARTVDRGNEGVRAFAAGNVPTGSDIFGLRLAGYWEEGPGWVDNRFGGKNANTQDRWFVRAKARLQPAESFRADLLYQHYESEFPALGYSHLDFTSDYFIPFPNEVNYDLANLVLNWDAGPFEVTSSTGYQHRTIFNSLDISGYKAFVELLFPGTTDWAPLFGNAPSVANPITNIGYSLDQVVETFSQEVRVNAGLGEMFHLTAGAFYKDSKHLAPLFTDYYPDANVPVPEALGGELKIYTESWAVFGELTATVDRFEAIAGIRYYEDTRDSTNIVSQFGAPISVVDTVDNDKVALRFVLKYNFTDDLMAYASYADGFRSGGIQFFDAELFGIGENTFDPEELSTWEVGAKGTLGEGTLDFEFAAFLTKYKNVQVYAPNPLGLQAFNNGGRAEVEGIEVAATLNLTDNLFLRATYGLNDGKYTRPGTTHIKGDPMDGVPDYTLSLAADYSFQWWGDVGGHARLDYFFQDDQITSVRGFGYAEERVTTEGIKSLNARVGWMLGSWSLYVFGENLTNEEQQLGVPIATVQEYVLQQPRTFGLTARMHF